MLKSREIQKGRTYRTAIYCRLSKEDGDKEVSNSIEGQIAYCKDFVDSNEDLVLVREPFCDDGYTGLNMNRPAFLELDSLVQAGEIDCLVCRDLSRFTRDYIDGGEYLEKKLPRLGVRFIAINNCDTLKDDPQAIAFMLPIMNLFNDNYSRDTSIKIRSSLTIKRERGDFVGSFCPYGYTKSDENRHKLIPDEDAVAVVQLIFSLFKDGKSIPKIATHLNEMSIATPVEYRRSKGIKVQNIFQKNDVPQWEYTSVRRILENDVYIGILTQGKRSSKNYKVKELSLVPPSQWVKVENAHAPIVNSDDFFATQELLKRNTRTSPKEGVQNVLSGFIFCGDCGGSMVRKTRKTGEYSYVYYVCSNNKNKKTCSSHSINCSTVEESVMGAIHNQIELVLEMDSILDELEDNDAINCVPFSYQSKIKLLEEGIEKNMKSKLRLYTDLKDEIINQEEYEIFKEEFNTIIQDKKAEKERLEKKEQDSTITGIGTRNWVRLFREHEYIEDVNRRVLMALVDKVNIYENQKVEVVFKYSDKFTRLKEYITFLGENNQIITL